MDSGLKELPLCNDIAVEGLSVLLADVSNLHVLEVPLLVFAHGELKALKAAKSLGLYVCIRCYC